MLSPRVPVNVVKAGIVELAVIVSEVTAVIPIVANAPVFDAG